VIAYCSRCGARLTTSPPTTCATCGYQLFVNPRPTGSVILLDRKHGDRYLVIRRVREPCAGAWDLPGGFCDGFEHPRAAAVREAREELGVEVSLGAFVGMYVGSYVFQDEQLPILDCFWLATIESGEITLDPTEASALTWADLDNPPKMAFATMDAALGDVQIRRRPVRLIG
jgi:8-oxo-dGTP pyrophosphatase MutT (NUDIX family)